MSESPSLIDEPYEPPESLWQFIKSVANERELDVIKSQIGESLVETSLDLHNEIDTLLEIWRDYRNETMTNLNQLKHGPTQKLPEPPNIRETLKKEICLFVKQMREQYKNDDQKFRKQIATNNHNLNVINYVLNTAQATSDKSARPVGVRSRQSGAETPALGRSSRQKIRYSSQSRSSSLSALNTYSSPIPLQSPHSRLLDENLELLVDEDKINSIDIDQIVDSLRDLLQTECDTLLSDIEFLYECIDKESDYRVESKRNLGEPSLNELKEERRKLESDLLTSTGKNQVQISKLPSSVSALNSNRSIKSPLLNNRVTPSPPTSASSTRSRQSIVSVTNRTAVTTANLKPVLSTKRSLSLSKPTRMESVVVTKTKQVNLVKNQLVSSTGSSNADLKPVFSRTSSAASSIDSLSLSLSSRTSAAQKFRQMVLESRD